MLSGMARPGVARDREWQRSGHAGGRRRRGEIEAAVDLGMSVDYGVNIPQVADAVRNNIVGRVQAMTGLIVKEVNIDVTDLYFPTWNAGQDAGPVATHTLPSRALITMRLFTSQSSLVGKRWREAC